MDTMEISFEGGHSSESINLKNQFSVSVAEAPVEIIDLTNRVAMERPSVDAKLCTLCKENNYKYNCRYCDVK